MLSLSRGSEINKTPRNLSKLIDNSVNFSIDAFKSKNNFQAKIEKRLEDVGRIDVYSSELTRVFVNIIDNSLYSLMKKSNEVENFEPLIKVSLERVEDKIRIEIVDNGIGISEENLKNIFNPFFTTKPSGEGTGLGMSMAYDIIKKHGGTIDLFSTEGEGVTTKIELPNEKV
ncbi:MAG: HAMP domain-containing sensor histidine kinase [Bdellovibrionota bacterium]|nr:HAMP domain-containing sensor histidine kinase [Bdellovibrionota bacterium]